MRRTELEIISEVQDYCRTPKKKSHIMRTCNLCFNAFNRLIEKKVVRLHHKEKGAGRHGSHYYIANSMKETKEG